MKTQAIWIVEMLNDTRDRCRWEPTVGIRLTRKAARAALSNWRVSNPGRRFRIRKYAAIEPSR